MGFHFGKDYMERSGDEVKAAGSVTGMDYESDRKMAVPDEDAAERTETEYGITAAPLYEPERNDHNGYVSIHFIETRKYLQQVRDLKRSIRLMENRIGYRKDAGYDTSWHEEQLESLQKQLKISTADVAEEISRLGDVNQEVVMTKRYIDVMSWDEIAATSDLKMRTVQKCHGHALPAMEQVLLEDGLITLGETEDDFS